MVAGAAGVGASIGEVGTAPWNTEVDAAEAHLVRGAPLDRFATIMEAFRRGRDDLRVMRAMGALKMPELSEQMFETRLEGS
jgi:hypothetical protein